MNIELLQYLSKFGYDFKIDIIDGRCRIIEKNTGDIFGINVNFEIAVQETLEWIVRSRKHYQENTKIAFWGHE